MLFDLTEQGPSIKYSALIPPSGGGSDVKDVLAFWEEHCVECGAPACYVSCKKFSRTLGGKCRRFKDGVQLVALNGGRVGYAVHFREWGKMELVFSGKIAGRFWIRTLTFLERCFAPVNRFFTRLLPFLPWNRNPIAIYRTTRKQILKLIPGRDFMPNQLHIVCRSEMPVLLRVSIIAAEGNEVFASQLKAGNDWQDFVFNFPKLRRGALVRLFSIDGTPCQVLFSSIGFSDGANMHGVENGKKNQHAPFVKCVAWDLDNTIWDGILVDKGLDGVKPRDSVIAVIKALDKRGIVSTICSKNEYDLAWEQLKRLGIEQYFVFPQINWNPKSANIQVIARDMNIGLDSFAFVDDSIHERGEVMEHLPMVRVFTETEVEEMLVTPCFNPPISIESASRRMSYLNEMKRKNHAESYVGSYTDFLHDCEILLACEPVQSSECLKRCWELVNRTNQLTIAARRYEFDEFTKLLKDPRSDSFAIRCRDKYGDYGIVGFISISRKSDVVDVTEFVMSCRVAKKMCEQSVLLSLAERMKVLGALCLEATVICTGRNGALLEAFDAIPFEKITGQTMGQRTIHYKLKLDGNNEFLAGLFRNKVEWM